MKFIGIDPDLSTLAMAWVDKKLVPTKIAIIRAKSLLEMLQLLPMFGGIPGNDMQDVVSFAVESQDIYMHRRGVDPRDILHVGQVAGAAYCTLYAVAGGVGYFPRPAEWKGQVDKLPHHRRICRAAGIPEDRQKVMGGKEPYISLIPGTVPGDINLNPGDWKHAMDAIGLAQYAVTTYLNQQLKQRLLQEARR